MSGIRIIAFIFVFIAALGVGFYAVAAPSLPVDKNISEEILCLQKITEVRIAIDPLPADVRAAGVRSENLMEIMKARLDDAGIKVTDAPKTTRLVLKCLTLRDSKQPNTVAVIFFLDVQQRVTIERLNAQMTLPTTTVLGTALTTPGNLKEVTIDRCHLAMRLFTDVAQQADLAVK